MDAFWVTPCRTGEKKRPAGQSSESDVNQRLTEVTNGRGLNKGQEKLGKKESKRVRDGGQRIRALILEVVPKT